MRHSLAGRAETPMQARVLARLRDEGPLSKAQLADLLKVSRTTIAAEAGRLAELGLAQEVGPAASRGGRRSTLIDLAPAIRFVGIAIGATGISVGVTDGRLAVLAMHTRACDIRQGPEPVLAAALDAGAQGARRGGGRTADGRRGGRARPGRLPPRGVGVAADHAWLGRLPGPRRPLPGAGLPRRPRQRRERAGRGRATRGRGPQLAGLPLRQDRHRHRLRHRDRR